ncbi:hypothetical protein EVAR_33624_1 [Eumeta japonica]|uniref:Uncharacterized protein n=1 Tax=Eumeta variegata TaxID=151549 RepID=A0A4C1WCP3_EUMVA|nr:hypothetical protein EVAR_33624_1 [Eumeta japonica]
MITRLRTTVKHNHPRRLRPERRTRGSRTKAAAQWGRLVRLLLHKYRMLFEVFNLSVLCETSLLPDVECSTIDKVSLFIRASYTLIRGDECFTRPNTNHKQWGRYVETVTRYHCEPRASLRRIAWRGEAQTRAHSVPSAASRFMSWSGPVGGAGGAGGVTVECPRVWLSAFTF